MPILLKTQVDRTAKTPATARRARVGGLCRFRRAAERVPTKERKTARCANVREHRQNKRLQQNSGERRPLHGGCGSSAVKCKIERFWTLRRKSRTKPRGRARPAAVTSARGADSFGLLRGRSKGSEKQSEGVAE